MKYFPIFTILSAVTTVSAVPHNKSRSPFDDFASDVSTVFPIASAEASSLLNSMANDERKNQSKTLGTYIPSTYNPGAHPSVWTGTFSKEHTTITVTDNGNQIITGSTQLYTTITAINGQFSGTYTEPIISGVAGGPGGGIMTAQGSPPTTVPTVPMESGTSTA
ncbi:hypothetical protein EV356DRAFT_564755 [Viridothelium virens]|uniref:Uncharacterized protein n=1 Tax=Viridothelium virens TaxID=1048519 RepID=A0A6A6HHU8_VIRVR|nr:hypothetical protein EV356DRAFT_564755 [Viridothelium virens]